MKLTTRYILVEIAWPCLLAFVIVCFLGVANELRERLGVLDSDFVRITDFARLAFYFVPTLFTFIIPITFMLGILLAFGGMAQNNEITAMRAAGIPLRRLVLPVMATGLALSIVSFALQDKAQPWAIKQAQNLIVNELYLRGTLDALPPGKMHTFPKSGLRVYFGEKDRERGEVRDIDILMSQEDGRIQMFHAASARIGQVNGETVLRLEDVHIIQPIEEGFAFTHMNERAFSGPELQPEALQSPRSAKGLAELVAEEQELVRQWGDTRNDRIDSQLKGLRLEIASRFTLPLACFSVCVAATPLAVRRRSGGRSYSFAIGLSIAAVFYVTLMAAESTKVQPLTETIIRGLAPNIVLIAAGLWFLWRVDRV